MERKSWGRLETDPWYWVKKGCIAHVEVTQLAAAYWTSQASHGDYYMDWRQFAPRVHFRIDDDPKVHDVWLGDTNMYHFIHNIGYTVYWKWASEREADIY